MSAEHASDWWKLLPLVWIGSSVLYSATRWHKFSSIRDGAFYYEPWAQVSRRGRSLKWMGLSAEVAIDPRFLKVRFGFLQSVIFFFGGFHREMAISRAQIKSARFSSSFFGIARTVEIAYEDDLGPTTMILGVNDPDQVLAMLSRIGEGT